MVRPSARTRKEPRLKRTFCSAVRWDVYGCQCSCGMVGKKLQRSNSSMPSDSDRISTSPTRIVLFAIVCPPLHYPRTQSDVVFYHKVYCGKRCCIARAARVGPLSMSVHRFGERASSLARLWPSTLSLNASRLRRNYNRRKNQPKLQPRQACIFANMSHERRTPMNGAIGMTELALSSSHPVAYISGRMSRNIAVDTLVRPPYI